MVNGMKVTKILASRLALKFKKRYSVKSLSPQIDYDVLRDRVDFATGQDLDCLQLDILTEMVIASLGKTHKIH